jgi:hypothetical protein
VENGHNVAVIENHSGDSLENIYSTARINYYGITAFPTVKFDGVLEVVGGSGSQSLYANYVPLVAQRNAVPSDFTIDIELENTGLDYTASITMENVGGNTSSNLVLQVAITESHLPLTWGLGDEVNSVNRLMVPNQNGTTLDFSGNSTQTIELNFTVEGFWDTDNCEVIAFIQDNTTKEIQQGTKKYMAIPLYNLDAEAKSVKYPTGLFCGSTVEPVVLIKNMGSEPLTSCDIEYSINGGTVQTFNWTGDIGFNLGEEVVLDEISFVSQPTNTFEFTVLNPNGEEDPNPDNNTVSADFDAAPQITTTTINFELKTDNYPEETSWELLNSTGDVLYSGGPYSGQANTIFNETWEVSDIDCYTFKIYDAYGDGICCAYGNGYYKLMDIDNNTFAEGGQFGSEDLRPFEYFDASVVTANFMSDITTLLEGGSVQFTDLSSGDVTDWEWTFEGGDPASSTEQNPMVTYNTPGSYDVTLTVSNLTSTNTFVQEDYITVDALSGIQYLTTEGFNVYPNPFDNFTNISLNIIESKNVSILVYDLIGKIVYESNEGFLNAGKHKLTLKAENLENGIYFIKVAVGENVYSHKVSVIN